VDQRADGSQDVAHHGIDRPPIVGEQEIGPRVGDQPRKTAGVGRGSGAGERDRLKLHRWVEPPGGAEVAIHGDDGVAVRPAEGVHQDHRPNLRPARFKGWEDMQQVNRRARHFGG